MANRISITINRENYTAGEKLTGKVTLTLEKPAKARELKICFYGERIYPESGRRSAPRTVRVYENEIAFDGKKEYPARPVEYAFSF